MYEVRNCLLLDSTGMWLYWQPARLIRDMGALLQRILIKVCTSLGAATGLGIAFLFWCRLQSPGHGRNNSLPYLVVTWDTSRALLWYHSSSHNRMGVLLADSWPIRVLLPELIIISSRLYQWSDCLRCRFLCSTWPTQFDRPRSIIAIDTAIISQGRNSTSIITQLPEGGWRFSICASAGIAGALCPAVGTGLALCDRAASSGMQDAVGRIQLKD